MKLFRLPAICLLGLIVAGCSGGGETVKPVEKDPLQEIRAGLERAAETGAIGSEIFGAIEELRKTDAAKADELEKGCSEMMSMPSPAQVKAKAKELLGTLGGTSSGGGSSSQ